MNTDTAAMTRTKTNTDANVDVGSCANLNINVNGPSLILGGGEHDRAMVIDGGGRVHNNHRPHNWNWHGRRQK